MKWPGQAVVEFALVLPVLLFLILAVFQLALLTMMREELGHAAREAAIVGCPASETVERVLGRLPERIECTDTEGVIAVVLGDPVARVAPFFGDLTVTVTGRAVAREPDASPMPGNSPVQ